MRLAQAAPLMNLVLNVGKGRRAKGETLVSRGDFATGPTHQMVSTNRFAGFRGLVALLLVMLIALFGSTALARTVKIVQASKLELRNVTLPDGAIEEYIIITGAPAVVLIDQDEVSGERLEYNKTRRKLRVIGTGSFKSRTETVAGKDFDVDLETQGLQGTDVFIATQDIDIVGIACQRLPGQLEIQDGYFSPCARCGKEQDAYGFKAAEITLYPGDRLIARNVTILAGGVPIFYLPIVVIFLNDPSRQPRLDLNQSAGADGVTVDLDLPFTVSDFGQGFTLLRYFEKRTPAFGFGIDLTLYDLFGASNRSRFFFMALPPPVGSSSGVQLAYQISGTGELPLTGTVDVEDEFPALRYDLLINRVDAGITKRSDLRGVSGENKRSNFSVKLSLETTNYALQLETRGFWDHRDAPIAGDAASLAAYNSALPGTVQYLPEVRFAARGNLLPRVGAFGLSAWGVTLGYITAPFDPFNSSARRLAGDSRYVSAGKFSLNWTLGVDTALWDGARVGGSSSFRGQYYSTRNPALGNPLVDGESERNISFTAGLTFSQSLFSNAVSFSGAYNYGVSEGESPFAFDRVAQRKPNSSLSLNLRAVPFTWLSFGAGQRLEFTRLQNPYDPLTLSLGITPAPLNASLTASYDWKTARPIGYSLSLQNTVSSGLSFSVQTGFRFSDPLNTAFVPLWDDLRLTFGYRSIDARFSAGLGFTQNPNNGEFRNWTLNSTWILGERDAPITLTLNQTLTPPQYSNLAPNAAQPYSRLSGSFGLRWQTRSDAGTRPQDIAPQLETQTYTLSVDNALDFAPYTYSPNTPFPNSRVALTLTGTAPVPWSLRLNAGLDLATFEFFQPTLSGQVSSKSDSQGGLLEFALNFQLLLPWRNQDDWRFSSVSLSGAWDVLPGFSIFSSVTYSRTLSAGIFRDRFNLNPIGFSFAFAEEGSTRPSVFFAVLLRGTYEFSDAPGSTLPMYTPPPSTVSGSSSVPFLSDLRPIFVLTFDQCCYSVVFTFDSTQQAGLNFSISLILPFGKQDIFTDSPVDGVRFPVLPFIPAIPRR